jgi:hypothetical protein
MRKRFQLFFLLAFVAALSPLATTVRAQSDPSELSLAGRWAEGPSPTVAHDDGVTYVASGAYLKIVDFSNPETPVERGRLLFDRPLQVIATNPENTDLYVSTGNGTIHIVDAADAENPRLWRSIDGGSNVNNIDVAADGYSMFVAADGGLFRYTRLPEPSLIVSEGSFTPGDATHDVDVQGSYAYVATQNDQLRVIDISNPGNFRAVGSVSNGDPAYDLLVSGDYAYVARDPDADNEGLYVFDISTPSAPRQVAFFADAFGTPIVDMTFTGGFIFAALRGNEWRSIDVRTPTSPETNGPVLEIGGNARAIAFRSPFVFVATGSDGLRVYDLGNDISNLLANVYAPFGRSTDVAVVGEYAYVANGETGLRIVDVSEPESPREIGTFDTAEKVQDIAIEDAHAYVVTGERFGDSGQAGLRVLDVSQPASPTQVSSFTFNGFAYAIDVSDDYAYVVDRSDGSLDPDLRVVSLAEPSSPEQVGTAGFPRRLPSDVAVEGNVAYLTITGDGGGVLPMDVSTPSNPDYASGLLPTGYASVPCIAADGDLVYTCTGSTLGVVNVSDPSDLQRIGSVDMGSSITDIALRDDFVYGTTTGDGVRVVDVLEPSDPREAAFYDTGARARDVAVTSDRVYVADGSDGLYLLGNDVANRPVTPAAPTGLTATAGDGQITLSWTGNDERDLRGYNIYRSTSSFIDTVSATKVNPALFVGSTTYTDQDLAGGGTYHYRLTAVDEDGNESALSTSASVFLEPATVSYNLTQTFGDPSDESNYRLVALPGDGSVPVSSTLDGEAGDAWRVFWDNGQSGSKDNYLIEHDGSDRFQFAPGRGFWMLSENAWQSSGEVETVSLDEDGTYPIDLHDGWNIVSNPFGTDVDWSTVQEANGVTQTLWRWNGSYQEASSFASAQTGRAYYFFNEQGLDELTLPYPTGADTDASATESVQAQGQGAKAPPSLALRATAEGDSLASGVTVGRAENAEDGFDARDQYAPPGAFADTRLHLAAPFEAESGHDRLAAEYRPAGSEGQRFEVVLQTDETASPVTLRAEGAKDAFDGQAVALVNRRTAQRYDLRERSSVRVQPETDTTRFSLLVGPPSFVEREARRIAPQEAKLLGSYPNPFRTRTTIAYAVPEPSRVRLLVYNLLGRRVRTLVDDRQQPGRKQARFEGRGLSSGVYVYRLEIGDYRATGKVVLVR